MCFSNLPVEFDEQGNPYLAEDADDVEHVCDCGAGEELAEDPRAAYEALVASMPRDVRERVGESDHIEASGSASGPAEGD